MDLAIGAKQVFVMMSLFTRDGLSKLVEECTYPLTRRQSVNRIYSDYGIFDARYRTGPCPHHLRYLARRTTDQNRNTRRTLSTEHFNETSTS
ncbi:hypothetical protein [Nocardia salmonicida]|uniref:hypothetical protein n=1 Tax=Nocardia salmonicida TaxID=53431 RepID=UPI0037B62B5C